MSPAAIGVAGVCQYARSDLVSLGELGVPLLEVVAVVERLASRAAVDRLSEPAFALDVFAGGGEPAVIGRVLDFLRQSAGAATDVGVAVVDTAAAVAQYERGARAPLTAAPSTPTGPGPAGSLPRTAIDHRGC